MTLQEPASLADLTEGLLAEESAGTDPVAEHAAHGDDGAPPLGTDVAARSLREILRAGGPATVVVLTLLNVVDEFDRFVIAILGPDIQDTFGLNDTGLAALGGVGAVAVFAATIPCGLLADRYRRTTIIGVAATLWAGFALLGGLTRSALQLGATRVVNGLGKGVGPAVNSLLADRYPIDGRSRIFAVYNLANPVGYAIGPLLAAGVAALAGGTEGWRWSLVILSVPALALAVIIFFLPEPDRGANERHALAVDDDEVGAEPIPMAAAFERLRKIRSFAAIMSAIAMIGLALSGAATTINLLLEDTYGLDGVGRGLVASISSIGGLLSLSAAPWADRLYRRDPAALVRVMAAAMTALGVFYTASVHMPTVWLLVLFQILAGTCTAAPMASLSALIASVVPARMRGVSYAVMGIYFVLVGGLLGGILTGMLSDALGRRAALSIVFPIGCLGAAAYLLTASRHVRRDIALVAEELAAENAELERVRAGDGADELLQVRNLDVSYGPVQVLFGVDLTVHDGETLALLGTNGAGKSTLLRAISGLTLPDRGSVRVGGRTITYLEATDRVGRGIVQLPGGKATFGSLSVRENLLAGAHTFRWDRERLQRKADEVLELFPALVPLLDQPAGTLSGGEQQMLGLAKALLLDPRVLLIDELSLGLAPVAVQELLGTIERLKATGLTMVIVEQSINVALAVADRAVFMEKGHIRFEGRTADLLERDDLVRAVFLGDAARGGTS